MSTGAQGNVYVCGYTGSSGWGISGGWDTSHGGSYDGYVVKLDGDTGAHLWSSYTWAERVPIGPTA